MMPRLMPCKSSPPPGASNKTNRSVICETAVSDCPTPTVSISVTSNPAASQSNIDSRVRRVTPPSVVPAGDGRINAWGLTLNKGMRVLSPRIEPPLSAEVGSTASTATRCPASVRYWPSVSIKVDFPTPGDPEMPILRLVRPEARLAAIKSAALDRSAALVDSTNVMPLAKARRFPASNCSASSFIRPARR